MDAVDVRRFLVAKIRLCPVVIEIGARLYRKRAVEVQRRLPRCPDAARCFPACQQLLDLYIRIDGRPHRPFRVLVEADAARRAALLVGILPLAMCSNGDETIRCRRIVFIAMDRE